MPIKDILSRIVIIITLFLLISCESKVSPNSEMINLLAAIDKRDYNPKNAFCAEARFKFYDSCYKAATDEKERIKFQNITMLTVLELGDEQKAVAMGEDLLTKIPAYEPESRKVAMKSLALAYMRLAERINCVKDHSGQSCIFPVSGRGVHADKTNAEKAITLYEQVLNNDPVDFESRWLLNIAYMTSGGYPARVPPPFLIKGLDTDTTSGLVKPFTDQAMNIGLNTNNLSGGSIVDDFNNDGYFDVITSSYSLKEGMHYARNNTNGTFTELSDSSLLGEITGGLNIMQTDYNNDGLKDIFVLRGGWMKMFGKQPNSLLKNNGDGTFTDVTRQSGLLSYYPTQTATWADFNNDGWLDVFIGNETSSPSDVNPCEFYINNKNGTFTESAAQAGCQVKAFVKGVTSGDYDNDGFTDLFISTLDGIKILLKNESRNGTVKFTDVSKQAGLLNNTTRSFPTWFWDYDNDGWLDILVCGYEFDGSLAPYFAMESLNMAKGKAGKQFLFRNNHDGTFEEVSEKVGLNSFAFAMGSNFGDIDNDGYLDIYLGTGNPLYQSLVPNKLFKNVEGRRFVDVTTSARVGNLQKGHGVSFADLDNDGDEDIYMDMGGIYEGDAYENSLYMNPGQNNNNWINLSLEGVKSNRVAIGTKIRVTFEENGVTRYVYRDVNSGGSFGSNPLTQHIGIGQARTIQSIEIKWPASNTIQVFRDIQPGQTLKIKEGDSSFSAMKPLKADFTIHKSGLISCKPGK